MRLLAFVVVLCAFVANGAAQEQTLVKGGHEHDGFGGPTVKYTSVNGQAAVLFGGRGGWIIDHKLSLGGGAYSTMTEVNAPEGSMPANRGPLDIQFDCFGAEVEYIFHPDALLHVTLGGLVGGGACHFMKDVGSVVDSNQQEGETDFMLLIEPAVNAELNVAPWFRLNAGVSYRVVNGVEQKILQEKDFTGVTATLTCKFGSF